MAVHHGLFLLLWTTCIGSFTLGETCEDNVTVSKVYHWFVGETMSWNCTIPSCSGLTSKDITIRDHNSDLKNFTHLVDTHTKELRIENVTLADAKSYFCNVNGSFAGEIEMQIAYPPEPPDVDVTYNIFSDVYEEVKVIPTPKSINKETKWSFDIRYKLKKSYLYKSLNRGCKIYVLDQNKSCGSSKESYPCGCPDMQNSNCSLSSDGGDTCLMRHAHYTFMINMSSPMFGSAVQNASLQISDEIARAPPVQGLKSMTSSRSANVSWGMWSVLKRRGVQYRLYYNSSRNATWQGPYMSNVTWISMSGLAPNTEHQVKVAAKMIKSSIWGKPEMLTIKTEEDVPDESPKLSPGSYIYVSKKSTDCDSDKSSLILYTKDIPVDKRNGNLTKIVLNITSQSANPQTRTVIAPASNKTLVLCGVREDQGHTLELWAGTEVGLSTMSSRIFIPSSSASPAKPVHVVAEKVNDTTVKVSWTVQTTKQHDITIHICQHVDRSSTIPKCLGRYDWVTVSGPRLSYHVVLSNMAPLSELNFGVSVQKRDCSSGISWSSCVYDSNSVPGVVSIQVQPVKTKVDVNWIPPSCQQQNAYPKSYELRYGTSSEQNANSTDICDSGTQTVMVNNSQCKMGIEGPFSCEVSVANLEPSHWYFVCVRGISEGGSGSWTYPSQWEAYDTETGKILGAVFGCLIVIFVILALVRWCRKKYRQGDIKFEFPEDTYSQTVSTAYDENSGYQSVPNGGSSVVCIHSNGGFNTLSVPSMGNGFIQPESPGPHSFMPHLHVPVAESPGPDSFMPDFLVPESPGPDSFMPDLPAPESPGPDSLMPDLPLPESPGSQPTVPGFSIANSPNPDSSVPDMLLENSRGVDLSLPDSAGPNSLVPDLPVPVSDSSVPNSLVPDLPAPVSDSLVPNSLVPDLPAPVSDPPGLEMPEDSWAKCLQDSTQFNSPALTSPNPDSPKLNRYGQNNLAEQTSMNNLPQSVNQNSTSSNHQIIQESPVDDGDDSDEDDDYKRVPLKKPESKDSFAKETEDMWNNTSVKQNGDKDNKTRTDNDSGKPASRSNSMTQYAVFSDDKNSRTSSNSSQDGSDISMATSEQRNSVTNKQPHKVDPKNKEKLGHSDGQLNQIELTTYNNV